MYRVYSQLYFKFQQNLWFETTYLNIMLGPLKETKTNHKDSFNIYAYINSERWIAVLFQTI